MSEFARYLLSAGVTSSRFARVARLAYFRAASNGSKFRNSRLNQSAVAAMTGLTRVEVRSFAKFERSNATARPDRITRIVIGWSTDIAFLTNDSLPRRLRIGGRRSDFAELVQRYGGDLPARSVLRELERNGLVTVKADSVQLNDWSRRTTGQIRLKQIVQCLTQLLDQGSVSSENATPLRTLLKEVTYPTSSPKGRALVQRKSLERLRSFVGELQAAGMAASVETPPSRGRSTKKVRTRVLVITEEMPLKNKVTIST
jgi:Family of unknown function (DUF6502)